MGRQSAKDQHLVVLVEYIVPLLRFGLPVLAVHVQRWRSALPVASAASPKSRPSVLTHMPDAPSEVRSLAVEAYLAFRPVVLQEARVTALRDLTVHWTL